MISLVIPAYQEAGIIEATVRAADAYLKNAFDSYEVLVVDDGSTDGMAELVRRLESDTVRLTGYQPNRGKGYAVRTGMLEARGDLIFYTDADLAYGLEVIGKAVELLKREKADIVIGSRKMDKEGYKSYPPLRLLASKCFSALSRMISGLPYDTQCGLKGFRREAARKVFESCVTDRFAFDFEAMIIADYCGYRIAQLPVSIINHRESKVNVLTDSVKMLRDMLKIRFAAVKRMKGASK